MLCSWALAGRENIMRSKGTRNMKRISVSMGQPLGRANKRRTVKFLSCRTRRANLKKWEGEIAPNSIVWAERCKWSYHVRLRKNNEPPIARTTGDIHLAPTSGHTQYVRQSD